MNVVYAHRIFGKKERSVLVNQDTVADLLNIGIIEAYGSEKFKKNSKTTLVVYKYRKAT